MGPRVRRADWPRDLTTGHARASVLTCRCHNPACKVRLPVGHFGLPL
jgi:hypothetical protein